MNTTLIGILISIAVVIIYFGGAYFRKKLEIMEIQAKRGYINKPKIQKMKPLTQEILKNISNLQELLEEELYLKFKPQINEKEFKDYLDFHFKMLKINIIEIFQKEEY